jgi:hypothetical protein
LKVESSVPGVAAPEAKPDIVRPARITTADARVGLRRDAFREGRVIRRLAVSLPASPIGPDGNAKAPMKQLGTAR